MDYKALIDEYIENSNKFPYMYESIRESLGTHRPICTDLIYEDKVVTKSICVPFGKNKGEYIEAYVFESMKSWDETELTKWLLKKTCWEYFVALAKYGPWYIPENIQNILPAWNNDFLDYEDDETFNKIKNLFPSRMSEKQIRSTIRFAFEDARKDSKRQMPTMNDVRNIGYVQGKTLYKGQARDMVIHFWFDFDNNRIEMAYPADATENKQ